MSAQRCPIARGLSFRSAQAAYDDQLPEDSFAAQAAMEAKVEQLIAQINDDTAKVVELLHDESLSLRRRHYGDGHIEMIEVTVRAMRAWPVIEKLAAGDPLTLSDRGLLTALYGVLHGRMRDRDRLVREKAIDIASGMEAY